MSIISNHTMRAFHIHYGFLLSLASQSQFTGGKNPLLLQTLDSLFLVSFCLIHWYSEIFPIKWFMKAALSFTEFSFLFYWFFPKMKKIEYEEWQKGGKKFQWKFCVYGFLFRLVLFMCVSTAKLIAETIFFPSECWER